MKNTPYIYATQAEKQRDFILGVLGWIVLNVLLYVILFVVGILLSFGQIGLAAILSTDFSAIGGLYTLLSLIVQCGLPLAANIGALIYFATVRRWIAIGGLAAFGAVLLCALVAGIFIAVVCFQLTKTGV
jgi:hypothetical protein